MSGDLLPLYQSDLAPAGFTGGLVHTPKVARFTGDSLLGDDFNGIDGLERRAGLGRVLVKRCDPAGRGVRRIGVHGKYSYACWPGEEQESDRHTKGLATKRRCWHEEKNWRRPVA